MTSTPAPSIQITGLSLLRSRHGAITSSCNVALAGKQSLVTTHLLSPNQIGLLRATYQTTGPGAASGRVIYTESGHAIDGNTLVPGAKGSTTFLCAKASFSGSKAVRITAKVTLTYGSASKVKSMSFYVGKCANGTTGKKGTCVACKAHYKLSRGTCRRASQKRSSYHSRFRAPATQVKTTNVRILQALMPLFVPAADGRVTSTGTFKTNAYANPHH
jgi:hypothetical protein